MADKSEGDTRTQEELIVGFTVVMEDVQRQLRVLAEGQLGIVETLDAKIDEKLKPIKADLGIVKGVQEVHTGLLRTLTGDVDVLKTDMGVVKTDVRVVKKKVGKIEKRLVSVETRLGSVETKLGSVEAKLDQKADKSEHDALEAKVLSLAGDGS